MNDIAISVEHISKSFKLPHEKVTSVKGALINFARHKKGYEIQHVLDSVSFQVKQGEFFGIVGRNGSGKSTLLKLLAGIYTPSQGAIHIHGKLTPFIELGVGFNPELTGSENIYLNGALLGFSRKEMARMYGDIVEFAELERFMDQKLKNYSSGMQVRLAFSIAIRAQSDILVLDEVLAVGDESFQRKCYEYFYRLKRDKKTVVLVTHDMSAVKNFCDRAILIQDGKIIKEGMPDVVAREYSILNLESDVRSIAASSGRPGTKKLEFVSCSVLPPKGQKAFAPKDRLDIRLKLRANETVTDPIIGITIKDPAGREVLVTNTKASGLKTGTIEQGTTASFRLQFDNVFTDGSYMVSPGTMNASMTELYDTYEDACRFQVLGWVFPTGIVQTPVTITKE